MPPRGCTPFHNRHNNIQPDRDRATPADRTPPLTNYHCPPHTHGPFTIHLPQLHTLFRSHHPLPCFPPFFWVFILFLFFFTLFFLLLRSFFLPCLFLLLLLRHFLSSFLIYMYMYIYLFSMYSYIYHICYLIQCSIYRPFFLRPKTTHALYFFDAATKNVRETLFLSIQQPLLRFFFIKKVQTLKVLWSLLSCILSYDIFARLANWENCNSHQQREGNFSITFAITMVLTLRIACAQGENLKCLNSQPSHPSLSRWHMDRPQYHHPARWSDLFHWSYCTTWNKNKLVTVVITMKLKKNQPTHSSYFVPAPASLFNSSHHIIHPVPLGIRSPKMSPQHTASYRMHSHNRVSIPNR